MGFESTKTTYDSFETKKPCKESPTGFCVRAETRNGPGNYCPHCMRMI